MILQREEMVGLQSEMNEHMSKLKLPRPSFSISLYKMRTVVRANFLIASIGRMRVRRELAEF
jgi:hypothetical protein